MPRIAMEHGELLDAEACFRCGEGLPTRTKSHFTGEPIGPICMKIEMGIKDSLEKAGHHVEKFRGCGYLPDVANKFKKPKKLRK